MRINSYLDIRLEGVVNTPQSEKPISAIIKVSFDPRNGEIKNISYKDGLISDISKACNMAFNKVTILHGDSFGLDISKLYKSLSARDIELDFSYRGLQEAREHIEAGAEYNIRRVFVNIKKGE